MINKKLHYAVVGVSSNTNKYGYIVFKDLLAAGYKVYGVNPRGENILGQKIYKSLDEINHKIDVAIFVVPSAVTLSILPSLKNLNIKNIWLQPGAESDEIIAYCQKNNINYTANSCIMIERS